MRKSWRILLTLALGTLFLLGCQKNPSQNVVTSKNNGEFEQNLQHTSPAGHDLGANLNYSDTFFSTDGSIEFEIALNQDLECNTLVNLIMVVRKCASHKAYSLLPFEQKRKQAFSFILSLFCSR